MKKYVNVFHSTMRNLHQQENDTCVMTEHYSYHLMFVWSLLTLPQGEIPETTSSSAGETLIYICGATEASQETVSYQYICSWQNKKCIA